MRRIIGGLIVVSLLSGPLLLKIDLIKVRTNNNPSGQIESYAPKYGSEIRNNIDVTDVDELMTNIDENNKAINGLLLKTHNIVSEIEYAMVTKAQVKGSLTEEQICLYQKYTDSSRRNMVDFDSATYQETYKKQLNHAQQVIMRENSDVALVYNELNTILDYQCNLINDLRTVSEKGEEFLAVA